MSDARYELHTLQKLVTHRNATGRHLIVTFTCPVSRTHVNARHTVPESRTVASTVARTAQTAFWYEVRRSAAQMVYAALGHGVAGRMASTAVHTALASAPAGVGASGPRSLSEAEQQEALVAAFRAVEREFAWTGDRWVHRTVAPQLVSPLEAAVEQSPLTPYDRLLLARMAVEIAQAHGGIGEEERAHLEEVLDPAQGSLESLLKRPPLTRAELGESTPGARKALLALATAAALADQSFDAAEQARLDHFAAGLGVSPTDRDEARALATGWVLDRWFEQAFTWGGHDAHLREQAVSLGARLGLSREQVELAEARFQKRRA